MNSQIFARNELIWGQDAQEKLFSKSVVVFGLGGVGSYAAESLARSGVGQLTLVDFDKVSVSNINRQLPALMSTVGLFKADVMEQRIRDINPDVKINAINDFYTEDLSINLLLENKPDFVIDAIDTLRYKILLIETCLKNNIPIVSSMGAGNRMCPEMLYLSDISEIKPTKCSFVNNVRQKLKTKGITSGLKVVTSSEKPIKSPKIKIIENVKTKSGQEIEYAKFTPGSSPFVPPVAGFIMAGYVVRKLIEV